MVSDADGTIRRLFQRGRVTYLLDADGTVRFVQKGVPDNQALLQQLQEINLDR